MSRACILSANVGNLSDNIVKCMDLNTTFSLSEACPPEKIQTQIYSSGIKSIKPACNFKFFINALFLSDRYHFIGKFFKDLVIFVCISLGKIAARYYGLAKSKMVRLLGMCSCYADKLSKTFATGQLPEHHYQQLIPATKRLDVFISLIFHNNTLKCFLWEKLDQLCKYIFSVVHKMILLFFSKVKIQIVDMRLLLYYAFIQFVIKQIC